MAATSKARIQLDQIDRAIATARKRAAREVRPVGRAIHARMSERFAAERYANSGGRVVNLGSNTVKWNRRKAILGLDPRRGHASRSLSRAIKSRSSFITLPTGFRIDISVGATVTNYKLRTSRARKGKPATYRRGKVIEYLAHYVDRKAPGLGSISTEDREDINEAIGRAVAKALAPLRERAAVAGAADMQRVELRIEQFGLKL
jgi:hypothetical protein